MVKYLCANCNFKFEPMTDRAPRRCEYCGESGSLRIDLPADSYLQESLD